MKSKIELKANCTIVFIGDSITDAGRFEPYCRPFGRGYVHFTANMLLAKYPRLNLKIINSGISGDTIRDLALRWQEDCIRYKPDILSVLIGVNDVWRQHTEPDRLPEAVYIEEYESTYRQLLAEANRKCNCQVVLMEPFMFCDDPQNQMFRDLRNYIEVVRKMSDEFDALLVPLQSSIDEQIKNVPPEKWADDSVHPFVWAHCWISQRWLEFVNL